MEEAVCIFDAAEEILMENEYEVSTNKILHLVLQKAGVQAPIASLPLSHRI